MSNFLPGNPLAPRPLIMNILPLCGENGVVEVAPVAKLKALLPVRTNKISRSGPPKATAVTISAGNLICSTIFDFLGSIFNTAPP